jgi:hypothetical protein
VAVAETADAEQLIKYRPWPGAMFMHALISSSKSPYRKELYYFQVREKSEVLGAHVLFPNPQSKSAANPGLGIRPE